MFDSPLFEIPEAWRCPRSPTGRHQLGQYLLTGDRQPDTTQVFVQCCHCGNFATAMLADACVDWHNDWTGATQIPSASRQARS